MPGTGQLAQRHAQTRLGEKALPLASGWPVPDDTPALGPGHAFSGVGCRRRETVHTNPMLPQLHGHRACKIQERTLAGAVADVPRLSLMAGGRNNVDDAALPSMLDHQSSHIFGTEKCS